MYANTNIHSIVKLSQSRIFDKSYIFYSKGNVNVTVNIYNVVEPSGEKEFVDSYWTEFVYNMPSDYYILLVLTSEMTNTK